MHTCPLPALPLPIFVTAVCYWPRYLALLTLCAVAMTAASGRADESAEPPVNFSRQIRTILSDKCFKCHGPDENTREADLRLDVREAAEDVLAPGHPQESELIRRITSDDPDERMPPPESKLSLTEDEIQLLRRWVREGAEYQRHWAFAPIVSRQPPQVRAADWPANDIDRFVLSRIEAAGLVPSEAATRETLIRRLRFDLTGLPPTLEEIDEFVSDESNDAYEKLVDRLLGSDAFGERMASTWLDAARYSDSYGYQVDRDRYVWPWRDWVIRAFHENMPYDQFLTEQLAGDLLPDASDDQVLATTFNRLHPQKVEGGSVPEEFRVEYVADRTHTFATAMLGLTLECARCHDHKFDPLRQKEYYQLFAFFNNIDEAGLYSYFTSSVPTPTLLLADENKKQQVAAAAGRVADAERKLAGLAESGEQAFQQWLAVRPDQAELPGLVKHVSFEDHKDGANKRVTGKVGAAVKLSGDDGISSGAGNFRRGQPFSVTLWLNTPDVKRRAVVFHRSRAWTDAGSRGYQLLIENGKLSASLIHFWPGNAIRVRTANQIPVDQWVHVAVVYDGSSRADGLRIYVDGRPAESQVVRDNLFKNITGGGGDHLVLGQRFRDRGFTDGLVDELKIFSRQLTPLEIAHDFDGTSLKRALATPGDELTPALRTMLAAYYRSTVDQEYRRQLAAVESARDQYNKLVDGIREIMVMREQDQPAHAHLLERGAYNARAERVVPDTPSVFPPFGEQLPRNRLGLARWLTTADHPLTARVAVNRIWQMLFGAGFVRTPEDFGSQGRPPSHPQLLDYLADDFIQSGWDVKRLVKQIVMSATYRQTSQITPQHRARDPENVLLARSPRYRWPAEMLRDGALAISGLLVDKVGGSPARPYELEASFKPMGRAKGEGLYRRSLYTYWKRTGPAPVMMSLDAAKRDVCVVKRERTSSPSSALVLMNGTQFVEAARVMAERVQQKHGDNEEAALVEIFRRATSRRPRAEELQLLKQLFTDQHKHFRQQPDEARRLLETGDWPSSAGESSARVAALTTVANVIMNTSESMTKR